MAARKPRTKADDNNNEKSDPDALTVSDILARFGFSTKDINRIKLGSGIVGKLAPMTNFLTLGLIAFALATVYKGGPWYISGGSALLAVLVYIYGVRMIMKVTHEHPDLSLLEGAELLAYRQQEFHFAAKGSPNTATAEIPQSDPTLPAIEPPSEVKDQPEVIVIENEGKS